MTKDRMAMEEDSKVFEPVQKLLNTDSEDLLPMHRALLEVDTEQLSEGTAGKRMN